MKRNFFRNILFGLVILSVIPLYLAIGESLHGDRNLVNSVAAQNRLQRQDYNGLRKGTDLALFIRSFLPSVVVLVYSNGNGL
jgi:ABC-type glycerol-3-phosphate transport system permease component